MIHEIKICNIGSFQEEATLSLIATDYGKKLGGVIVREGFSPVLNSCVIYGANSSGKTQFIRALYDFQSQLRGNRSWEGSQNLQRLYNPFKFNSSTIKQPSKIEIKFDYNSIEYCYKVEYDSNAYRSETLEKHMSDRWELVFDRRHESNQRHVVIVFKDGNKKEFPISPYVLGLSVMLVPEVEEVSGVAKYLAYMQICNGYNWNMMGLLWGEVQMWLGNELEKKRRKEQIRNFLNAVDVRQEGIEFPVSGDASFDKIVFQHNQFNEKTGDNNLVKLNIMDESNGSKWLLLLGAKVIETIENGYTLFVDELDACFHPQVTLALIGLFKNKTVNRNNAQLILTTHNVNLMDEKELRRDQVWFIQKNNNGKSELFSLADFTDVDENTPFANWYMANRFGATPNIDGLEKVFFANQE